MSYNLAEVVFGFRVKEVTSQDVMPLLTLMAGNTVIATYGEDEFSPDEEIEGLTLYPIGYDTDEYVLGLSQGCVAEDGKECVELTFRDQINTLAIKAFSDKHGLKACPYLVLSSG